jgi:cyclase
VRLPCWLKIFENTQIQTIPVADGVYMLMGEGGNIGVSVGDDGVFLIDDEYAPLTDKVLSAVEELSDQPVRFLINTHWHSDHTGGNENLGRAGVVIVAHNNVRQRMSTDQFIESLGREVPASPSVALPIITFNDTVTFHLNDHEINAFHVAPAHTDGDSVVHFQDANVIHMGDTYFNGIYPSSIL